MNASLHGHFSDSPLPLFSFSKTRGPNSWVGSLAVKVGLTRVQRALGFDRRLLFALYPLLGLPCRPLNGIVEESTLALGICKVKILTN